MFKGKLIEEEAYYQLRKRFLVIGFIGMAVAGILYSFFLIHWGFLILYGIVMVSFGIYQVKTQKKILSVSGNKRIELDNNRICIVGKKGNIEKEIPISQVQEIRVNDIYQLAEENLKSMFAEMKGKPIKNHISVDTVQGIERFDFIVDSYYMIEQLKKVIDSWKEQGIPVSLQ
ncbi:MAG: hypothetical protein K9H64_01465 [Bacteroidales bacterium]|nr:hypothetical protein [Bacteroidales bacterium]MCF8454572.1 hypothetical protein [Bacteroidales bacterium]